MTIKQPAAALGYLMVAVLAGCGGDAPVSPGTSRSVAICKEVMKLHSEHKQDDSHTTEKLQQQCKQAAESKTPEQWQCVLNGVRGGGEYIPVSSKCFGIK